MFFYSNFFIQFFKQKKYKINWFACGRGGPLRILLFFVYRAITSRCRCVVRARAHSHIFHHFCWASRSKSEVWMGGHLIPYYVCINVSVCGLAHFKHIRFLRLLNTWCAVCVCVCVLTRFFAAFPRRLRRMWGLGTHKFNWNGMSSLHYAWFIQPIFFTFF